MRCAKIMKIFVLNQLNPPRDLAQKPTHDPPSLLIKKIPKGGQAVLAPSSTSGLKLHKITMWEKGQAAMRASSSL